MKIKKFPQSCVQITSKSGGVILIDPGKLKYQESFLEDWKNAEAVLITHKHGDHFYTDVVGQLNIPLFSTSEVANKYPQFDFTVIKEGDELDLKDFHIEVVKAVHGFLPKMKNSGGEVFENIGFIISVDGVSLYVSSDTICFNNDFHADYMFAPVTGHGVTMSSYETGLMAKDIGVKKLIVCHLDNEKDYPMDLNVVRKTLDEIGVEYILPEIGQEIELI